MKKIKVDNWHYRCQKCGSILMIECKDCPRCLWQPKKYEKGEMRRNKKI